MANTIVDSIMNLLPSQVAETLAARFNVSQDAAVSGVGTGVAAVVSALAARSHDAGLMQQLLRHATDVDHSQVVSELGTVAQGGSVSSGVHTGAGFISSLFGAKLQSAENAIAAHAGLPAAAGASLIAVAAPLTLTYLGKEAAARGLNASSLGSLLSSHGADVGGLLPAGVASMTGAGSALAGVVPASIPSVAAAAAAVPAAIEEKKSSWVLWVIGLILLGLLAWVLLRGCNPTEPVTPPAPTPVAAPAPVAAFAGLGEFIDRKLPDGTVLHIPSNGIENHLIDFIESDKPVDKTTWFDFDRLTFDIGKATLQPSSDEQLKNIEAILKAYPKVHAKFGGYTDNTGNAAANLKLSDDRAQNVMHEIVTGGIAADRLEAKGYGEEHPVADDATAEGRQKNRRISMLVTAK